MTIWYHLRHRETGEEHTVATKRGWPGGYPKDAWELMAKHNREKGAHDDVVNGKLVHNAERKALEERHAAFATWSPGQIIDYFTQQLADLECRLTKED